MLSKCKSKLCVAGDKTLANHLLESYSKQNLKPEISFFLVFFLSLLF